MSIYVTVFSDVIKAKQDEETLRMRFCDMAGNYRGQVSICTSSTELSAALAEAINGVMARFAKPAPAEAPKEAAE